MTTFIVKHKLLFSWLVLVSMSVAASLVLVAFILQSIVDSALQQDWDAFQTIAIKTGLFLIVFGLLFYTYGITVAIFRRKVTISLRQYIVDQLSRKNLQQYGEKATSSYLSMLTNDVKQIEDNYMNPLINIIQHSIMFSLSLAALLYLNVVVTLVLVGCVLIMFIVPSLLAKVLEKKQTAVSNQMVKFTAHVKDFLEGFDVLYSYRVIRHANKRFKKENEQTAQVKFEADHVNTINNSLSNVLGVIAQFAVILVSGYLIIRGDLTGGGLVALVQLSGSIVSPIVSIFSELPRLKSVKGIVTKVIELNKEQDEEQLTDNSLQMIAEEARQVEAINMKNVSFSYNNSETTVLHNITQSIELGKKYAIIGESGCGKTTLVKLLAGQLQHTKGEMLFDDDKTATKQQLIALSAMVSQKVFLFNETMAQNIALNESFSEKLWQRALEHSGVNKFIGQIDGGIDAMVGEGGSNLSGGQRQRISIARALIRNKSVVILDEGTSALDIQTSYEVESQLLEQANLTLLTITHQINEELLRQYDHIIYMEAGRIVETGCYDELISNSGKFKSFTTINHKQAALAAV